MGMNSNIEWCDHTFNAWIGCTKVSPGCRNCYAEADFDKRKGRVQWGPHGTRSVTAYANWRQVLSWQKMAKGLGERKRVFVNSLADTFEAFDGQVVDHLKRPMWFAHEDRDVDGLPVFRHEPVEQWADPYIPLTLNILRRELFVLIGKCPDLDFLLLTKRPENIAGMWPTEPWGLDREQSKVYFDNIHLGTSVEDQKHYNERVPELMKNAAGLCAHTFVSMEPMLGPIDIRLTGVLKPDQIIVGGESGKGKRDWDPDWGRDVLRQCRVLEIAFFGKQWDKVRPLPEDLNIREYPTA